MSGAPRMRVRTASLRDHDALCALFDELDEFHRRARPDLFQPFAGPARTREQVARWLPGEATHGTLSQAGLPKTFRSSTSQESASVA